MDNIFQTRIKEFTTPSGHVVTIREQNGADDDILSNTVEAATLMNLSRFIAGIVVKADYYENGKLNAEQAHKLPALDRYAILFQSRIFSLGDTIDFTFDWRDRGGQVQYEQDLNEFLYDYSKEPTEEELEEKPNAIPFYPGGKKFKDFELTTSSGKLVRFDLLTASGEAWAANLPAEKQTRNAGLLARKLRLLVNDKWETVSNFSMFSVKDMIEIRREVLTWDPVFTGNTTIENPSTHDTAEVNVVSMKDFFYLGEI